MENLYEVLNIQNDILIGNIDIQEQQIKKRKLRCDIGKPREKRVIKEERHKIMIVLNGEALYFKNTENVKRFFENEDNVLDNKKIKDLKLTEEIKYILTTPFLLRRLCYINNGNDNYLKKNNTRQKYLSIPNLKIVPLH